MRSILAGACLLLLTAGCARSARPDGPSTPRVTLDEATSLVPPHVPDREGWALDVLTALDAHHFHPDVETVCQVLAVTEQESGYKANPPVANLAKIARERLDGHASKLGPLGPPMMDKLLDGRARGWKATFKERLARVRTERDLDLIFRDLLAYYEEELPAVYAAVDLVTGLAGHGGLEALNPITTAGSMQVSVQFSVELSEREGLDEARVRDRLYTRSGGVHYGSARLLGYDADYDRAVYRFADYNAGFYASRNAAFQEQLATVMKRKLSLDGDLLVYEKDGAPADRDSNTLRALLSFRERFAPSLSERQLRRDVRLEKTRGFEDTETWRGLKRTYAQVTGAAPAYARLPEVAIRSPKLSRERSTAWFARSVDARYQRCLERGR
ncbi:MAG: DUF1615 family protein [Myxococcaceae bacterium]